MPFPVSRRASLCGVAALSLVLAACDGSGEEPPSPNPSVVTSSTERTTTTTTGPEVTSSKPAANNNLEIDRDKPDVAITGRWTVTEFLVEGEWNTVEFGRNAENEPVVGANAEFEPWIELGDEVRGYPGGCNEFGGEYLIDGNALSLNGWITLRGCPLSDLEDAFSSLLSDEVIRVEVEGESMTWSTSDASLRFARTDSPPEDR